jgi:hypothetical protein
MIKYALFFFVLIGFSSCVNESELSSDLETIEPFKQWFEQNHTSGSNSFFTYDPSNVSRIDKQIFWNKARRISGNGMPEGFAIPVWFEDWARLGKQTIRELWIYRNRGGELEAIMIEISSTTKSFRESNYQIKSENFSGTVTFHDWRKGFIGGLFIDDSHHIQLISEYKITRNEEGIKSPSQSTSLRSGDCGYLSNYISTSGVVVYWVSQPCFDWNAYYSSFLMNLYFANSYTNGAYTEQWLNEQYGCEAQGNCLQSPPYQEPDIDYEEQARYDFNFTKIDDSNLKPCMRSVLYDVKQLSNGSVADIIQKFSGAIPGYNWEVKDGALTGSQNAFTSQIYNKQLGMVTTIFDASKFQNASDLSVARTILHESIHAYLIAHFRVDPLNANKTYPDLVKDYALSLYGGNANDLQHAEFVRNFVNEIALALSEFGSNKGYNLGAQFYQDLAWGGLTHIVNSNGTVSETTWFISTFPNASDRKRVLDVIQVELIKTDTNGTTQTQKGKSAGC